MTRTTVVRCLLIFAMLTSATTLTAFPAPAVDRAAPHVSELRVGRTVTLELIDGSRIKGQIVAITADAVTIRPGHDTARTVTKDDIRAIRTGIPRWGKVLIGVGVAYGIAWLLFLASGGIGPVCC